MVARVAEGRGAPGADVLAAPVVLFLLPLELLLKLLEQLFKVHVVAHLIEACALLVGELQHPRVLV